MIDLVEIAKTVCEFDLFDSAYCKRLSGISITHKTGNCLKVESGSGSSYIHLFSLNGIQTIDFNVFSCIDGIVSAGIYKSCTNNSVPVVIPDPRDVARKELYDSIVNEIRNSSFTYECGVDFFYIETTSSDVIFSQDVFGGTGLSAIHEMDTIKNIIVNMEHSDVAFSNGIATTNFLGKVRSWLNFTLMDMDSFVRCCGQEGLSDFDRIQSVKASYEKQGKSKKCVISSRISIDINERMHSQSEVDDSISRIISMIPGDVLISSSFQEFLLHLPAYSLAGFMPSLRHITSSKKYLSILSYAPFSFYINSGEIKRQTFRFMHLGGMEFERDEYSLFCGETPFITKAIFCAEVWNLVFRGKKIAVVSKDESIRHMCEIICSDNSVVMVASDVSPERAGRAGVLIVDPKGASSENLLSTIGNLSEQGYSTLIDANDSDHLGLADAVLKSGVDTMVFGGAGLYETYKRLVPSFIALSDSVSSASEHGKYGYYGFAVNSGESKGILYIPYMLAVLANATNYDALSIISSINSGVDPVKSIKNRIGDILRS